MRRTTTPIPTEQPLDEIVNRIQEQDPVVAGFVTQVLLTLNEQSRYTLNELVGSYQNENLLLRATLWFIRDRLHYLFSGTYMPTSAAILGALHPSTTDLQDYVEQLRAERH